MNQILVSEKVYVTKDMKRKKLLFKIEFFLSVFLICILSSYAIYAEYDRNKSEEVSKDILGGIEFQEQKGRLKEIDTNVVKIEDNVIEIILNSAIKRQNEINLAELEKPIDVPQEQRQIAKDGTEYFTIGSINIPSININYPILSTTTVELLKVSPCKFWGANPNQVGNLCIVGHNYRNSKFFSKVPNLPIGDIVEITDLSGNTLKYEIYDKYIVEPTDVSSTTQKTEGRKEITLITCTNDNKQRHIIKAREII